MQISKEKKFMLLKPCKNYYPFSIKEMQIQKARG